MSVTRRRTLGLIGSALCLPYILRTDRAAAAVSIRRLGRRRRLGADQPGGNLNVAIDAFPSGGFVATWLNVRGTSRRKIRAFAQRFGNDGAPTSAAIQMGGAGEPTDGVSADSIYPVTFRDGSSLILFSADRNGAPALDSLDIFAQRMSSNFQKIGTPVSVSKRPGAQVAVLATRLRRQAAARRGPQDDTAQVVYLQRGLDLDSYNVKTRAVFSDGTAVNEESEFGLTGLQTPRDIASLADGGSVVSCSTFHQDDNLWTMYLQMLLPDGAADGRRIILKQTENGFPFGSAGVAGLPGGGFCGCWFREHDPDAREGELLLRIFDGTGAPGPRESLGIYETDPDSHAPPNVYAFSESGSPFAFLTRYDPNDGNPVASGLVVTVPDGEIAAGPTPLHEGTPDALDRLSNGDFVSGWGEVDGQELTRSNAGYQLIRVSGSP